MCNHDYQGGVMKKIPKPTYPCHFCYDDFFYAEELFWSDQANGWICDNCFCDGKFDEPGISLADYIKSQDEV